MRSSLVLFSSILLSRLKVLTSGCLLGRDIPDRRSRLFFDLHRNRDHPVSTLGVLGGLLHHLAVARALSHEVAAGYQLGAPEFSRHVKNPPSDSSRSRRMKTIATRRIRLLCGRAAARAGTRPGSAPARPRPSDAPDQRP